MKIWLLALLASLTLQTTSNIIWDKTIHDFGDVSVSDGPLSCTFTLTNKGEEPVVIYEVVASCGCTNVSWSKNTIKTGETGTVTVTYKNEDGPYPFEKNVSCYITGQTRPVILRLRGVVHDKKKSLEELYGAGKIGKFGLKSRELKLGTVKQGLSASEAVQVANLGKKPLRIEWKDVSEGLSISVSPNPIPAGGIATLSYSYTPKEGIYGLQTLSASPIIDGKADGTTLEIDAHVRENFDGLDEPRRKNAPVPVFETSTLDLGFIDGKGSIELVFKCTNKGKSPFHIYKVDSRTDGVSVISAPDVQAGGKGVLKLRLDSSKLPKGENVINIILTTNAPLRPVLNLFATAVIK